MTFLNGFDRLRKTIKKLLLSLGISGIIIIFGLFARNQWRKARALGTTRTYIRAQNLNGLAGGWNFEDNLTDTSPISDADAFTWSDFTTGGGLSRWLLNNGTEPPLG